MRPFLLLGASDKIRYGFALDVARENGFHFIPLEYSEIFSHEKDYYTSSLDEVKCLFYIHDVNNLSIDQSKRFLEIIKDSPHRFVLSSPVFTNWILQKQCLVKPLGEALDEIGFALKQLQTNPDRDAIRLALANVDPIHIFHIIKKGFWNDPERLETMMRISRNIYRVHHDYILSALVFALNAKPFSLSRKRKVDEMQKAILKKIAKAMPYYSTSEVADVYHLLVGSKIPSFNIELTDEEKSYLGLHEERAEQAQEIFCKSVSLSDYF